MIEFFKSFLLYENLIILWDLLMYIVMSFLWYNIVNNKVKIGNTRPKLLYFISLFMKKR